MGRIFIIGSGRSGTTVLQSFLAAHPRVVSFPETRLFAKIQPRAGRRWTGIATRAYVPWARRFLKTIGRSDIRIHRPILMRQAARQSTALLDRLAEEAGADVWVEKTPYNIFHIDVIERYVPHAKFLHMIRDGPDVVASIVKVAREHPEWKGPATLSEAIEMRNRSVAISRRHLHKKSHVLVRYEDLMLDTETSLRDVCRFIGIDFNARMISGRQQATDDQRLIDAPWKKPVAGDLDFAPRRTFESVLTADEQRYVLRELDETEEL